MGPQRGVSAVIRVQKIAAKVAKVAKVEKVRRVRIPATIGKTIIMAKERVAKGRANQVMTITTNHHGRIVTTTRVREKARAKARVKVNGTDANTYKGWRRMLCQRELSFE